MTSVQHQDMNVQMAISTHHYLQRDRGVGDAQMPTDQANFNSRVGDLTDGYPETC